MAKKILIESPPASSEEESSSSEEEPSSDEESQPKKPKSESEEDSGEDSGEEADEGESEDEKSDENNEVEDPKRRSVRQNSANKTHEENGFSRVKSKPLKRKCSLLEEEVSRILGSDKKFEFVDVEEAEALEEKLREQKRLKIELDLKRMDLVNETFKLIMEGIQKSYGF